MGKESTRKAPGIRPSPKPTIVRLDNDKNLSLSDFIFIPYATDKLKYPVRLPNQKTRSEPETVQGSGED